MDLIETVHLTLFCMLSLLVWPLW